MKQLYVMDPLEKIVVGGDSTYVMMREASDRGHEVWMCTPDQMYSLHGQTYARSTPTRTTADAPYFHTSPSRDVPLSDFDVVWMRKDPPFDMTYIFTTYLLDMANTRVFNGPEGLKRYNEKMWVQERWPQYQPQTLISNDIQRIKDFVNAGDGRTVLKPWDGNGGRGVLITEPGDRNLSSMVEVLTSEGRDYVIAQRYLPGAMTADKRVLLFDGEVVGAMARVPDKSDHRANMHVGATVERCDLSDIDLEICQAISADLAAHDLLFVGIDLIDGNLTEINVTSPTGIQEINRLYGLKLEADLLDRVEAKLGGHT